MAKSDEAHREHLLALEARDKEQRAAIGALGGDFSKKRVVDLTFIAPDESSASDLVDALQRNELSNARRSSIGGRWLVLASIEATVDWITARENIATFVLFADKYGCEYDGWGTAVVEAAIKRSDR